MPVKAIVGRHGGSRALHAKDSIDPDDVALDMLCLWECLQVYRLGDAVMLGYYAGQIVTIFSSGRLYGNLP